MQDQGQLLRDYINSYNKSQGTNRGTAPSGESHARIISVTSGKGGVGKTNFTVNFAIELAKRGKKVLIIDADFGLSNIDVILGIVPKYDLSHVLNRKMHIKDVITEGYNGVQFISGGSGVFDLLSLDSADVDYFISEVMTLDSLVDIIIFDTGAGINNSNMQLISASDEVLLVVTTEPPSIIDAYAMCKMIFNQNSDQRIGLVVNKADSAKEAKRITENFKRVSESYLKANVREIGYILEDSNLCKSVKMQKPFTVCFPNTAASKNIADIAAAFLDSSSSFKGRESGIKSFFRKMLKG